MIGTVLGRLPTGLSIGSAAERSAAHDTFACLLVPSALVGPQAGSRAYVSATQETLVAKPNYHHARKQKELARKARQQEKQQRRAARPNAAAENSTAGPADASVAGDPIPGSGT
jgi:hypothetical protein